MHSTHDEHVSVCVCVCACVLHCAMLHCMTLCCMLQRYTTSISIAYPLYPRLAALDNLCRIGATQLDPNPSGYMKYL